MTQEAVRNAVQHADPTRVSVRLREDSDGWLELAVEDEGREWIDALEDDRAAAEYILEHSEETNPHDSDEQITFEDIDEAFELMESKEDDIIKPLIDFDAVFQVMAGAAEAAGLEVVRADFEAFGGFIHRPMYERLLLAEFLVADLTFNNANVAYEVGIRHGASTGSTVLVCEEASLAAVDPYSGSST